MERYTAARPDVFFTGRDGSLRSNRVLCQLAGQYAVDMFIGSSLQIDGDANSSTVTDGRLPGFGGAPNMGHDPHGRRHSSPAVAEPRARRGLRATRPETGGADRPDLPEGRHPNVCRITRRRRGGQERRHADPTSDDLRRRRQPCRHRRGRRLPVQGTVACRPPGGVVGDCRCNADRACAEAARTEQLRRDGLVAFPEDLGIAARQADRSLLAARSIEDLVAWSGGLYDPPAQFRDW